MSNPITLPVEPADLTEHERDTYAAVNRLLNEQPLDATTLWFRLGRTLYEAQPAATIRAEDGAIVCPHCGHVAFDSDDTFTGVSFQTEWEYADAAVRNRVETEASDQWNQGSGTLLYFECGECDRTFRIPGGVELVRS